MTATKILIGGAQHETNTFSPIATDMDAFRRGRFMAGSDLIEAYTGTGTELGGIIAGASSRDWQLLPACFGVATPGGIVRRAAFDGLCERLRCAAREPGISGALLALHGAMVAEHEDEADAALVRSVRDVLGEAIPIVATLDFHANVSRSLVEAADVLVGYDTFPHTDMAERGRDAAAIMARLLEADARPVAAFRKIPLLPASDRQITSQPPMKEIMDHVRHLRGTPGIVWASVAAGYPYADIEHLGMSVLVYATSNRTAEHEADVLENLIWDRRMSFISQAIPVADAVARAAVCDPPVILVDAADNVGGGAPGDGTAILDEILRQGLMDGLVVLWDPPAMDAAADAGVGGRFSRCVGAGSGVANGKPVRLTGRVEFLGPVSYRRTGSYMRGTCVDLGRVAVIAAGGNRIVLTSERLMPFDTDHLAAVGLDPKDFRTIVVKSGSAWRAAFGDIAATVINVDAPGITTQAFARLPYRKRWGRLFPIDPL